jgi:lysozyme
MNLELAAELCRRYEGYRAKPYLCPANVATIGYGSTYYADKRKVTRGSPDGRTYGTGATDDRA